MRGTVPTSIPDRNLVTEPAEGEAACERLLAYASGRKHLAQELIDLISGVLDKEWLTLLGELHLSVPVMLRPSGTSTGLRNGLKQRPEPYILKVGPPLADSLAK